MLSTVIAADGSRNTGAASPEWVEAEVCRRVEERVAQAATSQAARRLRRLGGNTGVELVRRVTVPGDEEAWWVKRGSFADLALVAMLCGRDAVGHLSLEKSEEVSGFVAAVLLALVVDGPAERRPYFESLTEARGFVACPCPPVADTVATLFYAAVELNPEVWPEGEATAKKVWRALHQSGTPGQMPARDGWNWPECRPAAP